MFVSGFSLFFRVINCASFIGLFLYFFYKKWVPSIRKKIEEEKAIESSLHYTREELVQRKHELQATLNTKKKEYDLLLDKALQWQKAVEQQQVQREGEHKQMLQRMKEKIAIQEKNQTRRKIEMRTIPTAVNIARIELQNIFSSEPVGKEYIQDIMNRIQKSV